MLRRLLKSPLRWLRRRPEHHLDFGAQGERLAARTLRRAGHRILRRNYRCPAGEIDLITVDGDELVFVEVKTRANDDLQDARDTVTPAKWRRIERAARYYLMTQPRRCFASRFDLVTVIWGKGEPPRVEHVLDAYEPRNP